MTDLCKNTIHFMVDIPPKCIMRIEPNRIWVDPEVEVLDAASAVIEALEKQISTMVSNAVADEREACAKVCEGYTDNDCGSYSDHEGHGYQCAAAVRARGIK